MVALKEPKEIDNVHLYSSECIIRPQTIALTEGNKTGLDMKM